MTTTAQDLMDHIKMLQATGRYPGITHLRTVPIPQDEAVLIDRATSTVMQDGPCGWTIVETSTEEV